MPPRPKPLAFIAGASCTPDIAMVLNSVLGEFQLILMWGTNTEETKVAHTTTVKGVSLGELEKLMSEEISILRQVVG